MAEIEVHCNNCGTPISIPLNVDNFFCSKCGAHMTLEKGKGFYRTHLVSLPSKKHPVNPSPEFAAPTGHAPFVKHFTRFVIILTASIVVLCIAIGLAGRSGVGSLDAVVPTSLPNNNSLTPSPVPTKIATPIPTATNTVSPTPTATITVTPTSTVTPTLEKRTATAISLNATYTQAALNLNATQTQQSSVRTATAISLNATYTQAAVYIYATQTQQSSIRTATAIALNATHTQAAVNLNATQTQQSSIRTATVQAYYARATFVAGFKDITPFWKDLATYSDKYAGQKVLIRGTIFNLIDRNTFQIYLAGTYQPFIIFTANSFDNLYSNDTVTVYGVVSDEPACGTNAFGVEKCYAGIVALDVVK